MLIHFLLEALYLPLLWLLALLGFVLLCCGSGSLSKPEQTCLFKITNLRCKAPVEAQYNCLGKQTKHEGQYLGTSQCSAPFGAKVLGISLVAARNLETARPTRAPFWSCLNDDTGCRADRSGSDVQTQLPNLYYDKLALAQIMLSCLRPLALLGYSARRSTSEEGSGSWSGLALPRIIAPESHLQTARVGGSVLVGFSSAGIVFTQALALNWLMHMLSLRLPTTKVRQLEKGHIFSQCCQIAYKILRGPFQYKCSTTFEV